MSTKPTPKRYCKPPLVKPTGDAVETTLKSPAHLMLLGGIVSGFTHLEQDFAHLLAKLVGTDWETALMLYAQIMSASGKLSVLKTVLQRSPRNSERGPEFDEILSEFARLTKLRNSYVHGFWTTDAHTGATYVGKADGDLSKIMTKAVADPKQMLRLVEDISACRKRILSLAYGLPISTEA